MLTYLLVVPVFLIMVTILVAAHEYGHYLFARMNGMEVEEFSIGFGKKLFVWMRKHDTEFTIRALPLGGFVRMKGMVPQEDGSETEVENGFYSKSPLRRLSVLFAGPLFSVLSGLIVLTAYFMIVGLGVPSKAAITGDMKPDSAAYKAGMKPDDLVISVDGIPVKRWFDVVKYVRDDKSGKPVKFVYMRGKQQLTAMVTPVVSKTPDPVVDENMDDTGKTAIQAKIGVYPHVDMVTPTFGQAVAKATSAPIIMVTGLLDTVVHPKTFSQNMGGPLSIVAVTYDAVKDGALQVIFTSALLSISLGVLNLLPFPPMDGGQIVIAFAEMLRRGKRLSMEIQNAVNTLGLALVSILIIAVLWVDVKRWMFPDSPPPAPNIQSKHK
jgi:regulator of sigma E protease